MRDIIVTARRTEERLQDVPVSITVFNQEELPNRNVVNAQDVSTYAPSRSANASFGNANTSFAIRGFVQEIGTAPSVGVYFADIDAPRGSQRAQLRPALASARAASSIWRAYRDSTQAGDLIQGVAGDLRGS